MVKNALSLMVLEIFWVKVDQKKKEKKEACKCNVFVDWSTKTINHMKKKCFKIESTIF